MKLKRISENTIRCTVTAEEMDQYEINLEDLLGKRDNAEMFFRKILQEAEKELGFTAQAGDLNVQLSVLPKGDVSMMISKGESFSVGDLMSQITEALDEIMDEKDKKALHEKIEKQKKSGDRKEENNRRSKIANDGLKHGRDAARQKAEDSAVIDLNKKAPTEQDIALARVGEEIAAQRTDLYEQLKRPLWAVFSSMDQVIRMVRQLDANIEIPSELYERFSEYYLRMNFDSKIEEASQAVLLITEFADTMFAEDETAVVFKEHANVVLDKNAIETLRSF